MLVRKFKALAATKLTLAATIFAFVFSQTAPAMAFGANGPFGGHDDIRAMVNFRIPLGTSEADRDRSPSFGFTVQRQFQFDDPLYETLSGSYRNSTNLTVDVMNLRFGMDGKLSGFDVGGFNAFQAKRLLNAADDGSGGTPTWVWVALGGVALVVVVVAVAASQEPKCTSGRDGPEIPCSGGLFP
jgi:hypothetical protein